MFERLALVAASLTVLKALAYFVFVGDPDRGLLTIFGIGDAIAVLALSPWIALGSPKPTQRHNALRAPVVPFLLMAATATVNVGFALPMADAVAQEANNQAIATMVGMLRHAAIGGVLGALVLPIVATPISLMALWGAIERASPRRQRAAVASLRQVANRSGRRADRASRMAA